MPSRHELFSQQICKERKDDFIPLYPKRNVRHGKAKGKELVLGSCHGFLCGHLSPVFLSALVSHVSMRSHTEAGAFAGNFQRNIELGAEVILYLNFLGKTLHVTLLSLC